MAKSKNTPLKDEPLTQYDDVCSKVDDLVQVINKQNEYLKSIAQRGGYDSEFNYINNELTSARQWRMLWTSICRRRI